MVYFLLTRVSLSKILAEVNIDGWFLVCIKALIVSKGWPTVNPIVP